jgi:chromosome segregation ATPase
MLEALKKKLGITDEKNKIVLDASTITAETVKTLTEATEAALNDLGAAEALMSEQATTIATLTDQLATATAALATVEDAKQAALAEAKAAKTAARKAVVVGAIGDAKAEAFLAATEGLDDAAFEAVTSALVGGVAAEADSALFTEVGVDANVDTTKPVAESGEMKILKAKYAGK